MEDNLACKNKYLCPFSMLPSLLKRIHTDIIVVVQNKCFVLKGKPNKLIQKRLVSNNLALVSCGNRDELIPISCKRPLRVFIPRASRFALLPNTI